jgi:hypothetical protein
MPTTGHLFERRYRGILVDADEYLLELVRYIHLNPVRAGIVTAPQEYAYSGHQAYLGQAVTPWLTCEFTLRLFAPQLTTARRAYQRFVLAGIGARPNCELTVGRSHEPRVLGSDRFLESIKNARRPRDPTSLENLIVHVCREMGVHGADLRRPGRRRDLARVRAVIVHHALERRLATLSEIARHFGRSASTLCESLQHYRRTSPELIWPRTDPETE